MQFFMYSTDPIPPDAPPPTPELMAEMGKFVQESIKAGVMVTTGGLAPKRARASIWPPANTPSPTAPTSRPKS